MSGANGAYWWDSSHERRVPVRPPLPNFQFHSPTVLRGRFGVLWVISDSGPYGSDCPIWDRRRRRRGSATLEACAQATRYTLYRSSSPPLFLLGKWDRSIHPRLCSGQNLPPTCLFILSGLVFLHVPPNRDGGATGPRVPRTNNLYRRYPQSPY